MKLDPVTRITRTGLPVELRSASEADAQLELDYLKQVCTETPFLLNAPEEIQYTAEGEREFIRAMEDSAKEIMLNVFVHGDFSGNGSIMQVSRSSKLAHRASLGIALFRSRWRQGIGEVLITELLDQARRMGYEIVELDVFGKNAGAIRLYEKMGFRECGRLRNGIRYQDGTYDDEIKMQRFL